MSRGRPSWLPVEERELTAVLRGRSIAFVESGFWWKALREPHWHRRRGFQPSCELACETESVWGHIEWETFILLGHTADSHSPYSPTLTSWNSLLVSGCILSFFFFFLPHRSDLINQSQLVPPSFRHWRGSTWLPRFTRFRSDIHSIS